MCLYFLYVNSYSTLLCLLFYLCWYYYICVLLLICFMFYLFDDVKMCIWFRHTSIVINIYKLISWKSEWGKNIHLSYLNVFLNIICAGRVPIILIFWVEYPLNKRWITLYDLLKWIYKILTYLLSTGPIIALKWKRQDML